MTNRQKEAARAWFAVPEWARSECLGYMRVLAAQQQRDARDLEARMAPTRWGVFDSIVSLKERIAKAKGEQVEELKEEMRHREEAERQRQEDARIMGPAFHEHKATARALSIACGLLAALHPENGAGEAAKEWGKVERVDREACSAFAYMHAAKRAEKYEKYWVMHESNIDSPKFAVYQGLLVEKDLALAYAAAAEVFAAFGEE